MAKRFRTPRLFKPTFGSVILMPAATTLMKRSQARCNAAAALGHAHLRRELDALDRACAHITSLAALARRHRDPNKADLLTKLVVDARRIAQTLEEPLLGVKQAS